MPKRFFYCTRPSLAGELIESGFKGDPAVNPYHPERPAWKFEMSTSLAFAVAKYYRSINKPIPNAIREHLKAEAPTTAAEYLN